MKVKLILGASILLFGSVANAALLDTTIIDFNASGTPNGISGTWRSDALVIGDGKNIDYFLVEIIELISNYGDPSSIDIESQSNHNRIAFGSNPVSGISVPSINNQVMVDSNATQSAAPWDFLLALVEGSEFQSNSGRADVTFSSGGGTAAVSGKILIQAHDSSVPPPPIPPIPIPAAIWLFGTALIGLVGFSKRRLAA